MFFDVDYLKVKQKEQTVIGSIYSLLVNKLDTLGFDPRADGALPSEAAIWWIRIIAVHWSLTPTEMGQNHHPLPFR